MNKVLILNADDFGYDEETDEAVKTLLQTERVTSVSLLTPAPAADKAARIANALGVPVGLHLCLTSDDRVRRWPRLSDAKRIGEALPQNPAGLTFGAHRADVQKEILAQYAFLTGRGCKIDHIDAHSGAFYGLAGRRFYLDAFDFASKIGLPFRFPKTPDFFLRQVGGKAAPAVKAFHRAILRQAKKRRVLLPDDVFSDPRSPAAIRNRDDLFAFYLDAVDSLRDGVTEFFLHPRASDAAPGSAWAKRQWEYELLRSGLLLRKAASCGVKVLTPGEAYGC